MKSDRFSNLKTSCQQVSDVSVKTQLQASMKPNIFALCPIAQWRTKSLKAIDVRTSRGQCQTTMKYDCSDGEVFFFHSFTQLKWKNKKKKKLSQYFCSNSLFTPDNSPQMSQTAVTYSLSLSTSKVIGRNVCQSPFKHPTYIPSWQQPATEDKSQRTFNEALAGSQIDRKKLPTTKTRHELVNVEKLCWGNVYIPVSFLLSGINTDKGSEKKWDSRRRKRKRLILSSSETKNFKIPKYFYILFWTLPALKHD